MKAGEEVSRLAWKDDGRVTVWRMHNGRGFARLSQFHGHLVEWQAHDDDLLANRQSYPAWRPPTPQPVASATRSSPPRPLAGLTGFVLIVDYRGGHCGGERSDALTALAACYSPCMTVGEVLCVAPDAVCAKLWRASAGRRRDRRSRAYHGATCAHSRDQMKSLRLSLIR